ncbi:uncharacterized protein V1518DRAFT_419903 [Limtongia smithiae]|uniref:uncharacterized protein n=1 Tax=Limtongia smithiae TaxID=1125753 RepID=UPI0034CDFFB3
MSVTISTGNVLHLHGARSVDPASALRHRISQWKQQKQHGASSPAERLIIPPNPAEPLFVSAAAPAKKKTEVTVKIFFSPVRTAVASRTNALQHALTQIRQSIPLSAPIAYLILSFPEITLVDNDEDDDEETTTEVASALGEIFEIWTIACKMASTFNIQSLGVSDFSASRLGALIKFCKSSSFASPVVNQINIQDCCVLPPSFVRLAAENGVKLSAHNDVLDVLPEEEAAAIVARTAPAGDIEGKQPPSNWEWFMKTTTVLADRGIVYALGWSAEFAPVQYS